MSCIDDKELALFLDGELTTNRSRVVSDHIASCAACRKRKASLEHLLRAAKNAYPPPAAPGFTAAVMRRTSARSKPRISRLAWASGLATVAAAGIAIVATDSEGDFVARGGSKLEAHLSARNMGFEVFQDGRALMPGTSVNPRQGLSFRIFNRSGRPAHLSLFGIDTQGEIHWFYPAWLNAELTPTSHFVPAEPSVQTLPQAVAPVDVPLGPLEIIAMFTDKPIDVRTVEAIVASGIGAESLKGTVMHKTRLEVSR